MQWLPLAVSVGVAAAVAPAALRALREAALVRANYRGTPVAFPAGVAILASATVALVPLVALDRLGGLEVLHDPGDTGGLGLDAVLLYVFGVSALGLVDDFLGARGAAPRGWRAHARAALRGRFSTGAVKASGSLGLALLALSGMRYETGEYLLAVGVLVLATNFFNLLDLRPGRALKVLLLLGASLTIAARDLDPLWALGLLLGPILVLLPLDLRERGMLGDTGASAVGGVAGLWLVLVLSPTGQAIAVAAILAATVYGEFRSISALIDRTPGLRHLDSLGRTSHA